MVPAATRLESGPETLTQRVKLLRDALGDDPASPRYVAGVRGRGYRLIPPVVPVEPAAPAAEDPVAGAPPAGEKLRVTAQLLDARNGRLLAQLAQLRAESLTTLERAIRIDPMQAQPRYELAMGRFVQDRGLEARVRRLIEVLQIDPGYTRVLSRRTPIHRMPATGLPRST